MAYVEHGMWEVPEVLRRAYRGEGQNSIARSTGRTRKTVRRYLSKTVELGLHPPNPSERPLTLSKIRELLGRQGVHVSYSYVPSDLLDRLPVLHAVVVTLVFSRHQYAYLTHSQKLQDVRELRAGRRQLHVPMGKSHCCPN